MEFPGERLLGGGAYINCPGLPTVKNLFCVYGRCDTATPLGCSVRATYHRAHLPIPRLNAGWSRLGIAVPSVPRILQLSLCTLRSVASHLTLQRIPSAVRFPQDMQASPRGKTVLVAYTASKCCCELKYYFNFGFHFLDHPTIS